MKRTRTSWLWIGALVARCGGAPGSNPDASTDAATDAGSDARPYEPPTPRRPPTCARPEEAPVPDGAGSFVCVRVGATTEPSAAAWPDTAGLSGAITWVQEGAPPGGDGTRARPYADIASGVAGVARPGTVVVARGRYALTAALALRGEVTVVGAGPAMGSTVTLAHGVSAFVASGADTRATVAGLAVEYPGAAATGVVDVGVEVRDGATVTLRDVRIDDAVTGVLVGAASLGASNLTVRRASFAAVSLTAGARAVLRALLARDGLQGLVARDAHVQLTDAFVMENRRHGVSLLGAPDATGGAARCPSAPGDAPGPRDCFTRVSIQCNGVAALYVDGARTLDLSRVSMSGTRAVDGASGDGLFAGHGARVTLDADIDSDRLQAMGSALIGNARAGLLARDDGTAVSVRGALVASNGGPGVFVGTMASAPEVAYSLLEGNTALGLGATASAQLGAIQCNGITATRMGLLPTSAGALMLGDGLSLVDTRGDVTVRANEVTGNARFAGLFAGVRGSVSANRGRANGYGLAAYASPMLTLATDNRVEGAARAPTERPAAADRTPGD